MKNNLRLSRRSVVIGQAALTAGLAAGTAGARPRHKRPNALKKAKWQTVTHSEMSQIIGDRFIAVTAAGQLIRLKLVEAEAVKSGANRPTYLPRSEGVIMVFSDNQSGVPENLGSESVQIFHKTLGGFDVLLGQVPRRGGGYYLEAVLN